MIYDSGNCGWKRCKEPSSTIFYSFAGLCNKHAKLWLNRKEHKSSDPLICLEYLIKRYCSKIVNRSYNETSTNDKNNKI